MLIPSPPSFLFVSRFNLLISTLMTHISINPFPLSCKNNFTVYTDQNWSTSRGSGGLNGGRHRQAEHQDRNITNLLDALLLGYDNHLRPNFRGKLMKCPSGWLSWQMSQTRDKDGHKTKYKMIGREEHEQHVSLFHSLRGQLQSMVIDASEVGNSFFEDPSRATGTLSNDTLTSSTGAADYWNEDSCCSWCHVQSLLECIISWMEEFAVSQKVERHDPTSYY